MTTDIAARSSPPGYCDFGFFQPGALTLAWLLFLGFAVGAPVSANEGFSPWHPPDVIHQIISCADATRELEPLCGYRLPQSLMDNGEEAATTVRAVVASPDQTNAVLLTGEWTLPGPAYLVNFSTNQIAYKFEEPPFPAYGSFSPDAGHLFLTSAEGHLSVLQVFTEQNGMTTLVPRWRNRVFWDGGSSTQPVFRPGAEEALFFGDDSTIYLRDYDTGALLKVMRHHPMLAPGSESSRYRDQLVDDARFSPDGSYLVTHYNGATYLWDLRDHSMEPVGYYRGLTPENILFGQDGQPIFDGAIIQAKNRPEDERDAYEHLLLFEKLSLGNSNAIDAEQSCSRWEHSLSIEGPRYGVRFRDCSLIMTIPPSATESQNLIISELSFDASNETLSFVSSEKMRPPFTFHIVSKQGVAVTSINSSLYRLEKVHVPAVDRHIYALMDFTGVRFSVITLFDPLSPQLEVANFFFYSETNCSGVNDAGRLISRGLYQTNIDQEWKEKADYSLWEYSYPPEKDFPQGKPSAQFGEGTRFCNTDDYE